MVVLAQIDPAKAAEGLGRDFLPYALVFVTIALVAVVVAYVKLQAQLLAEVKSGAEKHEKTLEKVLPLQERLLEMLELTKEDAE
jgi:hypothetical protein